MAITSDEDGGLAPAGGGRRGAPAVPAESDSPVVRAGERLVRRIETLVQEIARLRADNDDLRRQVREAVAMLEHAASAVGETRPRRRAPAVEAGTPLFTSATRAFVTAPARAPAHGT